MPGAVTAGLIWAGASAAMATAVVAVGTAVVYGAVIGAAVGAGMAALTGGDIGKGALYGAAIGGVTGGIAKGFSLATATPVTAAPTATMKVAAAPTVSAETAPLLTGAGDVAVNMPTMPSSQAASLTAAEALKQAGTSQIYAGIGQGATLGIGQVGAGMVTEKGAEKRSKKEIEAQKALEERKYQKESERTAGNIPGQFEAQVANITPEGIPDWWNRHLKGSTTNVGLLTPQSIGA